MGLTTKYFTENWAIAKNEKAKLIFLKVNSREEKLLRKWRKQ